MSSLKKCFVALTLVATACGDKTQQRSAEIKEYITTKVQPGINNIDNRIQKCSSSEEEFMVIRDQFKKKDVEKYWVGLLKDWANQDKIEEDDWDNYGSAKSQISQYFEGFYNILDRVKC